MKTIVETAILGSDGKVYPSGACHTPDCLPEGVQPAESGFMTDTGEFVTEQQAHEILDEKLEKTTPPIEFPQLGVEHRPETPYLDTKQIETRNKLSEAANGKAVPQNPRRAGYTLPRGTGTQSSYAKKNMPIGVPLHEDTHLMMNRIANKHGKQAPIFLSMNMFEALPKDQQDALESFSDHSTKGGIHKKPDTWHEENLAYMLTYLNSPEIRNKFHADRQELVNGQLTPQGLAFQDKMKKAYHNLRKLSTKIDKNWVSRNLSQDELFNISNGLNKIELDDNQKELAAYMLKFHDTDMPEFKAAKFMASGRTATKEQLENAFSEHEGNAEAAALSAFGLPVNKENLTILRNIIKMQTMDKSEVSVAAIPHRVTPFNKDSDHVAELLRQSYIDRDVHEVKLDGKHSKGTAIIKDELNMCLWLLKPGSGNISPAAGLDEESASQSKREVVFNKAAKLMGLGAYVPESALLILDGQEVAALEFFSGTYRPLEKLKDEENLPAVFSRFINNSLLYKWATMDYILGQTDRHAGNILMDEGQNIKFIDAGSTFAGEKFSPGNDPNSFIPYYLRLFADRKFKVLTPEERFKAMPKPNLESDQALDFWIASIDEGGLISLMHDYGMNPTYLVNRLNKLRNYMGSKSEFLRKFYSGNLL